MSSNLDKDALRHFNGSCLRLRKAFLELWIALRDFEARSREPVPLPRVDTEKRIEVSSVDSALRFAAGVNEILDAIDSIEDRDVLTAKASVRRLLHDLCEEIAELERLAGGENL